MAQVKVTTHHPTRAGKWTHLGLDDTGDDDFPSLADVTRVLGGYTAPSPVAEASGAAPAAVEALPVFDTMEAAVHDAIQQQSQRGEGGIGDSGGGGGEAGAAGDGPAGQGE